MKKLIWLADSRSNVRSFPAGVRDNVGYALYAAQVGEMSHRAKALRGMGSGVMEIVANDASGTNRAVYVYVIHAFQKKSKTGISTPTSEIELVRQRIKQLRREVKDAEKKNS